jgi:PKD repeat protein
MTFSGFMTFYQCAAAAQQNGFFTFLNGSGFTSGYSYTIIWGDGSAAFNSTTSWTSATHTYTRGLYNLQFVINPNGGTCSDTVNYRVFFGSNPAGGIASLGNTDICGPGWQSFILTNFQSNSIGTVYTVTFNDGSPPLTFSQPPPDSVSHYFSTSSCGVTSTDGVNVFNNAYSVSLTIKNPCGTTAAAVEPIYVSVPPIADYAPPAQACTGTNNLYVNTTKNGLGASASGCDKTTPILWQVIPATGWSVSTGSLGDNNGFTGGSFDPGLWTSGSNTLGINFTTPGNYQVMLIAANNCGPDTVIKTACVSAAPSPTIALGPGGSGASGCAPVYDSVINITPPIGGACGGTSFAWSVSQVSGSCTPDSANNYKIIRTDNNDSTIYLAFYNQGVYNITLNGTNVCGTFSSSPQTITVNTTPQLNLGGVNEVCSGQPFTPTSNPLACGGTISGYSWSFPGGTPNNSNSANPGSITYPSAGVYSYGLTVTNECGNADTSVQVLVDTIPLAKVGNAATTCSGNGVQIGAAPEPGISYSWSPPSGLSSPSVSNPTVTLINVGVVPITQTYYLTVSNAIGCSSTDSVKVTIWPGATVNAGSDIGACAGETVTLNGSFGGSATSVLWTSSNGGLFSDSTSPSSTYTPGISSGTVVLTLTTNKPSGICPAATASINVTVVASPTANAGSNVSVCGGMPIQIGSAPQKGYKYNWSPGTGLDSSNIADPTVTIQNTTNTTITQTYTLLVSAVGCSDSAQVTVTVYPSAGANAGPPATTCAGSTIALNGSISGAATSGAWSSADGTFSQPNSLSTNFTPTIDSGIAIVVLTTNQPSGNCQFATDTLRVTVNPEPALSSNVSNQLVCSGSASQPVQLSSDSGLAITWSVYSASNVTGYATSGTDSIPSQILTDTSTNPGYVIYAASATNQYCTINAPIDTIFVNTSFNTNAIAPQSICSGSSTQSVIPSATLTGVSFTWNASADGNMTGFISSGTDSIPAQIINNAGTTTDSVIYSITPSANGCSTAPITFIAYVIPAPVVQLPPAQSICSGDTTGIINLNSGINGTTFTWTTAASPGITGFADSGTGNIPSQRIFNADTSSGSVIYNIVATAGVCTGPSQYCVVTILPAPVANSLPAADSLCTGVQTNILLSSNMSNTTFSWTVIAPTGINGASGGTGDSIQQTLMNTGVNPAIVNYYVTPASSTCYGLVDTINVVVNPGTILQFSPGQQTICTGNPTQFVDITSAAVNATYSWVSEYSGLTGVLNSGIDSIPSQVITNFSGVTDTAKYLVSVTNGGCPGQTVEYDIIVLSAPSVILPGSQSICGGTPTAEVLLSSNTPGANFIWTASSNNGVVGFIDSGSTSVIPSQTLNDTATSATGSVVYNIQAVAGGCQGPIANYTITVSPTLVANPVAPQSMCSGAMSQAIVPSCNNPNATFTWQATGGVNIQGYAASGTDTIPADTLRNNGPTVDSVFYTITPVVPGCNANPITATIIVNPIPVITLPATEVVCNGQPTTVINFYSDVNGTNFTWTAAGAPGLSGYDSSGTGSIPQQFIMNTDSTVDTVNYTVIPSDSGCVGQSANYQIAVKPGLGTIINLAADSICAGSQTNIQLSSNMPGTTFTWQVKPGADIFGGSGGSGDSIQQTLTNTGNAPETITYIISSSASTCSGLPDSVSIVVNPLLSPQISAAPQLVCSGQSSQLVNITVPGSTGSVAWTASANGVGGVTATGVDSIPAQTLTNLGSNYDTVVYSIAPASSGCSSVPVNYNIVVIPQLNANLPAAQSICSGGKSDSVLLSANLPGTIFSWTATSQGASGFTAGGTSAGIPPQTIFNITDTAATVVYSVVPNSGTCSGPSVNYSIVVNPKPDVVLPATQNICNGASTTPVIITSHVAGTAFTWVSSSDKDISGALQNGSGNIPAQTLYNSGTEVEGVTYIITPQTSTCSGANADYQVTVNPVPQVNQLPPGEVVCSGQASQQVTFLTTIPGENVAWTAVIPQGITGADSAGTGLIPSQTLNNNTLDSIPQPLTINYNLVVSYDSIQCPSGSAAYSITVKPKPQADFTVSGVKGCSPLNLNVIASTMNYGVPDSLVFNWGDGTPAVAVYPNTGNPLWPALNHTFYNNTSTPETYNITMSAPGMCAALNVSHPVTVLPGKISAFFTASPASGCEPLTVTFHDESVGAGTLSWCFNFVADSCIGGGVIDTPGSTLTHTFSAGTYKVALYATNGAGCAQDTVYQTVQVTAAPMVDFISSAGLCADKAVAFTQQVTVPNGASVSQYQWTFGDGDSSLAQNPWHTYDTMGTYSVCLQATSNLGCSNQACHPVVISPRPIADFTYANACVNQQAGQFTSQSNGATAFQWTFGDGALSSVPDPIHDYLVPGNYTVTMIALNNICSDTVSHPVTIYPKPDAAFSLPQTYSCGTPSSVQITNNSTGAYSYAWDFGNGTISEFANPQATFTAQGTYTITLVAANQSNCFDTTQQQITVYPFATLQSVSVTPADGCQPLNVQFYANATNANSFVWNFGDGSSQATTQPFTSHLYTDTGTFSVVIQIYSYSACGDTFVLPDTVHVEVVPKAGFDYLINENTDPENGTVQFVNTSVNSTSYEWNFGDGVTSTDTNPSHMFPDVNSFQVMLIASNGYGCKDSVLKDIYVIKKSLYVPNVFAPDFSGVENLVKIWKPAGMGLSTYHAQVFDKWGELLWESTALTPDHQPQDGWDGTYQGKTCQQDVYVWKIEATFVDGTLWKGMSYPKEPERKTIGSVTVIR